MYPNRTSESSNAQTALRDSLVRKSLSTPEPDAPVTPRRSKRLAAPSTPRRSLSHATPVTPQTRSRKGAPATPTRSSGRIRKPSLKCIDAASTPSKRSSRIAANKKKGKAVAAPVSSSSTSSSGGSESRTENRKSGASERLPAPEFTLNHEPEDSNDYSALVDILLESWHNNVKTPSRPTEEEEEATFQEMLTNYTMFGDGVQFE